jgi:hypothetical protein
MPPLVPTQATRLILLLAPDLLLPEDLVKNDPFFFLDPLYFSIQTDFFQKRQLLFDKTRSEQAYKLLHQALEQVAGNGSLRLHSLYETCLSELKTIYGRTVSCTSLIGENPGNAFYAYLNPILANQLLTALRAIPASLLVGVYMSSGAPVSVAAASSRPALDTYQSVMGISTAWAHTDPSGNKPGTGNRAYCTIVESGWKLSNPELPEYVRTNRRAIPAALPGISPPTLTEGYTGITGHEDHGQQTLGVLLASHVVSSRPDRAGVVPDLRLRRLVNIYMNPVAPDSGYPHPEAAVLKAIAYSEPGDILLIEHTVDDDMPVESQPAFQLLLLAATNCLGITVIEPAGNNENRDMAPAAWLGLDSGAVLVGGAIANSSGPPFRNGWNYSLARISQQRFCFGPAPIGSIFKNTSGVSQSFSRTSAASAVIAGVACQIQSIYASHKPGHFLTPARLRALLCDPQLGLPVRVGTGADMGTLPVVTKIIAELQRQRWS